MKNLLVLAAGLGVVGAIIFFWPSERERPPIPASPDVSETAGAPAPALRAAAASIAFNPPTPAEIASHPRSPLADALGSANVAPAAEPRLVYDLFRFYLREFGSFPAGENNAQWINALRGSNPGRLPILPYDHPRLAPDGSLLDAWSEPFFIHQISQSQIQIRSAGPDRALFTTDDITFPNQ